MNIETLESIGMHSGQVNTLHLVVPMGLKLGDDSCLAEKHAAGIVPDLRKKHL